MEYSYAMEAMEASDAIAEKWEIMADYLDSLNEAQPTATPSTQAD